MKRPFSIPFAGLFLTLLFGFSACFRYQPTPDATRALESLDQAKHSQSREEFCKAVLATNVRSAEISLWKSECILDQVEQCRWFTHAFFCGFASNQSHPNLATQCRLPRNPLQDSFSKRTGTIFESNGKERAAECGYSEELTTTGIVLTPIGIVVGIPLYIVLYPMVCFVHHEKC